MRKRWLILVSAIVTAGMLAWYFAHGNEGPNEHQFQALLGRAAGAKVTGKVYSDLVTFTNSMGTFTIPTRCNGQGDLGMGYVTRWTLPDGTLMAQDFPNPEDNEAFQNTSAGGIGAYTNYLAYGPPPWRQWNYQWGEPDFSTVWTIGLRLCRRPGIQWWDDRQLTASSYRQGICLMPQCRTKVWQRWTFKASSVTLETTVRFGRPREHGKGPYYMNGYVKEPEVGFHLAPGARVDRIVTPGTDSFGSDCQTYTGLKDPRRRTGHCQDPARKTTIFEGAHPVRVTTDEREWRRYAAQSARWPKAGDKPSGDGYTKGLSVARWEYVVWNLTGGPMDWPVALYKAQEGGVWGGDNPYLHRIPQGIHVYRMTMTFRLG